MTLVGSDSKADSVGRTSECQYSFIARCLKQPSGFSSAFLA